jgi:hypothetical protein
LFWEKQVKFLICKDEIIGFLFVFLKKIYYPFTAHLAISVKVIFLPYSKMAVRYILAANQMAVQVPNNIRHIDRANSHAGTPNAMRKGIIIGAKKGIMDDQNAKPLLGFSATALSIKIAKMIGTDIGKVSDCASLSSLIADAKPANKAA